MVTIDDVAKAARVSKSTVSNVFSEKRPISKVVKERVLAAAKQLNYKPNYWARSLAIKETRIIGLSMRAEKVKFSQFHLSLLNGVLSECYKQGYRLLVNTLAADYLKKVEFQTSSPVDGEILLDPEVNDPRIQDHVNHNIPLVVIGKPPQQYENKLTYVDNDNISAAQEVVTYLLTMGHTNILFLNAPRLRTVSKDREMGYVNAFKEAGMDFNPERIVFKDKHSSSVEFGYREAKKVFSSSSHITAIITDNDKVALGVYRASEEAGYSIPKDLAVISFSDDSVYASELTPPLSCVHLNGEQLGIESAKLLIEQLQMDKPLVKRVMVPAYFKVRGSC